MFLFTFLVIIRNVCMLNETAIVYYSNKNEDKLFLPLEVQEHLKNTFSGFFTTNPNNSGWQFVSEHDLDLRSQTPSKRLLFKGYSRWKHKLLSSFQLIYSYMIYSKESVWPCRPLSLLLYSTMHRCCWASSMHWIMHQLILGFDTYRGFFYQHHRGKLPKTIRDMYTGCVYGMCIHSRSPLIDYLMKCVLTNHEDKSSQVIILEWMNHLSSITI